MKIQSLTKLLSWTAAHLAWTVMAFSPVAMGKEAENLSQAQVQNAVNQLGLNKRITLGEFWANAKNNFPKHVQKDFESYINENKNVLMPDVTIKSLKASDGTMIPVMETNDNGKIHSMQIFGQKEKMAKVDKVVFTQSDVESVYNMFLRYQASDEKLQKESEQYKAAQFQKAVSKLAPLKKSQMNKDFARFDGFVRITPQMWKAMSKEDRAGYIVKMRLMWQDAQRVLHPAAKKASAQNSFDKLQLMMGENAWAKGRVAKKSEVASPANNSLGQSCMVAGYVGQYAVVPKGETGANTIACSVDAAIAKIPSVADATKTCIANNGPRFVSCNPYIYGYPAGNEPCISKDSPEFQVATAYSSPNKEETCDGKSRLSNDAAFKELTFDGSNYNSIPLEKRIEIIEKSQKAEDYALTKSYLDGIFKKNKIDLKTALEGKWSADVDKMLIDTQIQFEYDIKKAMEACEAQADQKINGPDKNQKVACDQLHRRWLFTEKFIAEYRAKACDPHSVYIGAYDKNELISGAKEKTAINKTETSSGAGLCQCTAPPKSKVAFGVSCYDPNGPTVPPPPGCTRGAEFVPPDNKICRCINDYSMLMEFGAAANCPGKETVRDCEKQYPGAAAMNEDCTCKINNEKPTVVSGTSSDQSSERGDVGGTTSRSYTCDKSDTKIWPWLLAGGALLAFLLFKKDKKDDPAPVVPPTPVPPPAVTCAPPQTLVAGSCACLATAATACTAGQGIYNQAACTCTLPAPVKCADLSSAPSNNASLCPKCWDGSFKTVSTASRPLGCPNANEGGSTNPGCPTCSGGVY